MKTHALSGASWSLATDDPLTSSDETSSPARIPTFVSLVLIRIRSVRALLPQKGGFDWPGARQRTRAIIDAPF
jgi:hypothetical protein